MIKVILWDMDATLLDFLAAERAAMKSCFQKHGLGECTDEMLARYSLINRRYWEMLERGEMSKADILVNRFKEFFASEGITTDCAENFNADYQVALGDTICFRDNGYELVKKLVEALPIPVIAEGKVHYPDQAKKMLELGAHAVVVGGAITRPLEIAQRFFKAIEE